ncbi:MAG TPA: head maturation protease, ClpP-related [Pseudomonas sp.]|nr:head maturation protease, ClpP-related [Pseudomonas sp.]
MNIKRTHRLALAVALAALGVSTLAQPRIMNKAGSPDLQAEHWYSIRAVGEAEQKTIEVYLYGEIGYWGITSSDFVRDLLAVDDGISPIVVAFDSIGGDLFDGIAIHNALSRLGERCTARIDGACYSAASVAAAGAHRVQMADNALFMIHNPWTFAAGDSDDLRKVADMMDKAFDGIVASYQHRPLTVDDAELRRLINAETWLTAAEAQAHGFVDEVLTGDYPGFSNSHCKILNRYQHPPQAALDLLANTDPAPEPVPEPEPTPGPVALAEQLTADCQAAGLSDVAAVLIKASGLKSQAAIKAQLDRAKAVRDLCVLAKLPDEAVGLITAGLDADAARLKLFDKVVANSGKVEISNKPPLPEDQPAPTSNAVDPGAIYASRKPQASKGAHK